MSDTFDWGAVSGAGTPTAGTPDSTATVPRARPSATGAAGISPERLGEALAMLQDVAGSMAGLRAQLSQTQDARITAASAARHVTVGRARSGSGLTVTIDESWLEGAHERAVSRELLEALQAAHDEATRPSGLLSEDGPIGQLRALTSSPANLLGWLGLPTPDA